LGGKKQRQAGKSSGEMGFGGKKRENGSMNWINWESLSCGTNCERRERGERFERFQNQRSFWSGNEKGFIASSLR
jgi:hypothetical protein